MRKCQGNQVPAMVITLAKQCIERVLFNWAQFLYNKFLTNCREA